MSQKHFSTVEHYELISEDSDIGKLYIKVNQTIKKVNDDFFYSSNTNNEWMTKEELKYFNSACSLMLL